MLFGCGFGLLSAVWPLYLRDLGASAQDIGIVFGVGNLVAVLCFLPAGYLADRIGRKPLITAAWLCAALGVATFVPLTDWHGAFVGSALYWSGTAGLPLIIAYVTSTTPRAELGRALGIVLGAYFAGNIIGAPIAGVLAASIGFRAAIAIAAALLAGSAALTFGLRSVPPHVERGPFRRRRTSPICPRSLPFAAMILECLTELLSVHLRDIADRSRSTASAQHRARCRSVLLVWRWPRAGPADAVGTVPALLGAAGVMTVASVLTDALGRPIQSSDSRRFSSARRKPRTPSSLPRWNGIGIPPACARAQGHATYQVAFALGFGAGGTVAGFLYEADPLLPFIATAALALPVAAVVAAVLSRAGAPLGSAAELS